MVKITGGSVGDDADGIIYGQGGEAGGETPSFEVPHFARWATWGR